VCVCVCVCLTLISIIVNLMKDSRNLLINLRIRVGYSDLSDNFDVNNFFILCEIHEIKIKINLNKYNK